MIVGAILRDGKIDYWLTDSTGDGSTDGFSDGDLVGA